MAGEKGLTPYRKHFSAGHTLLEEGKSGTGFYILESGTLEVRAGGKKVAEIDAGHGLEFVGEVAALLGTPRTATVVAKTQVTALRLEIGNFEKLIAAAPSLGIKLAQSLAKKLAASQKRNSSKAA